MHVKDESSAAPGSPPANLGYWCVCCGRFLPTIEGLIVHDPVAHPDDMAFDDDERPQ